MAFYCKGSKEINYVWQILFSMDKTNSTGISTCATADSYRYSSASCPCLQKVKGKFTLEAFTGPDCTSAAGICATSNFSGDFAGTSVFIGSSVIPSVDTPTTGVVFLTGDTTLTTKGGVLLTKDAISLSTVGNGEFGEVDSIVGGTGQRATTLANLQQLERLSMEVEQALIAVRYVCAP